MVIEPVRGDVDVLGAMVNVMVPLPVPGSPPVMLIQSGLLETLEYAQLLPLAVTGTLTVPPLPETGAKVEATVTEHGPDWVMVKVDC